MVRWWKFSAVGIAGAVMQVAALTIFTSLSSLHYLAATALAVELPVLHNFMWHERWTWKDRAAGNTRPNRLLRFHLSNGLVSIVSNLVLMRWLTGSLHLAIAPANVISILITSCANFALGELFVYPPATAKAQS